MLKLDVYDKGSKTGQIELSDIWENSSEKVLHQVVVAKLANKRLGNAFTKTKNEVRGGGKKPWKQKGLGRARAGSSRSPLWRGGGVTFGPRPKSFSKAINKKQKTKAYLWLFFKMSELGRLTVIEDFKISEVKTKVFLDNLSSYVKDLTQRTVLILDQYNKDVLLSARNIPNVQILMVDSLDILDLVYAEQILVEKTALERLDEKYAGLMTK